ncbi:MAG: peptidylprolyl isomerase [Pseudomonadota bacterium]|nr:peptidylprolyl isomerase [Pseudomonadota bacterium]
MKLKLLIAALSASLILPVQTTAAADLATAPEAKTAESSKPLATVNGVALPQVFANLVRQARAGRGGTPESLSDEIIRDAVVTAELLAQEATRKGLDKGPTLIAALEFQKKEILSQALIEDFVRSHPISEEVLKAEYDNAHTKAGDTEYRPRHILVNSEKEAKELIAKLTAGKKAKFEDLARKESKDPSAGNGGDLGWLPPVNLVPEFASAMVKLKKGEVSKEPVQTKFGWHVIRLEETRKLDFPAYDKLKSRIANQLQQQQLRKYVMELRAGAKIE